MKKDLERILAILKKRHKKHFASIVTKSIEIELEILLSEAYFENRLVYKKNNQGHILFFLIFSEKYRGDLKDTFIVFSHVYCSENPKTTLECLYEINEVIKQSKSNIKKALINIDSDHIMLMKHFQKSGNLTGVELVGNVLQGIKKLNQKKKNTALRLKQAEKKDISFCVKRDIDAHKNEASSRMRERFSTSDAPLMMRNFYKGLVSSKHVFKAVVKESNKEVIVGTIGFFVDKKRSSGMIASIYVDRFYQKIGVSSFLYLSILKKFHQLGLKHYVGSTTTTGVLNLAKSIGRREVSRLWIYKI